MSGSKYLIKSNIVDADQLKGNASILVGDTQILEVGETSKMIEKYRDIPHHDYSKDLLIPGMIDSHVHIPQYKIIGVGKGELLPWLRDYVFPEEIKFRDLDYAHEVSRSFFDEMIRLGTTSAVIYSNTDRFSTQAAIEEASKAGINCYIGNSMMDRNSPEGLMQTLEGNISSFKYLQRSLEKGNSRIKSILTPRYAGSCSKELMKRVGELSKEQSLYIQTHLSENLQELEYIANQFPENANYLEVYDECNLLNERTILAHCIYLSQSELELIKAKNCIIAHCPSSNRYLESGVMPFANYLRMGLRIVLGTDVGAGTSLSMLNEAKEAIESGKVLNMIGESISNSITAIQAFRAMTQTPAQIMFPNTGAIRVGCRADLAIFEGFKINGMSHEEVLSKLIYSRSNQKAKQVIINGELYD